MLKGWAARLEAPLSLSAGLVRSPLLRMSRLGPHSAWLRGSLRVALFAWDHCWCDDDGGDDDDDRDLRQLLELRRRLLLGLFRTHVWVVASGGALSLLFSSLTAWTIQPEPQLLCRLLPWCWPDMSFDWVHQFSFPLFETCATDDPKPAGGAEDDAGAEGLLSSQVVQKC